MAVTISDHSSLPADVSLLFRFHSLIKTNIVASQVKTLTLRSFRAFTLIEILVVAAIIIILAALAVPVFRGVLDRAKATKDMNNLRQIGLLMQTYLNDKDGILPVINASPGIGTTLSPVIYGVNRNIYDLIGGNMLKVVSPSATILMAPNYNGNPGSSNSWTGVATAVPNLELGGGTGMTIGPQGTGTQINALFCDLHAETMTFGPSSV